MLSIREWLHRHPLLSHHPHWAKRVSQDRAGSPNQSIQPLPVSPVSEPVDIYDHQDREEIRRGSPATMSRNYSEPHIHQQNCDSMFLNVDILMFSVFVKRICSEFENIKVSSSFREYR